jgi:DNA ligase-1
MRLSGLLEELRSTSKPKEKIEILRKYDSPVLREILAAGLNPNRKFNLSLKGYSPPTRGDFDIYEVWERAKRALESMESSFSHISNKVVFFGEVVHLNEGSQGLFIGIINKNFQAGIGSKLVLRAFPELFQTFEVQLANKYDPEKEYGTEAFWWSPKLDGIRMIALRDGYEKWTKLSRTGKEIPSCEHLNSDLEILYQKHGVSFVDGEMYKHGLKFEDIQGHVMKKSSTAYNLKLMSFIFGDCDGFEKKDPSSFWVPPAIWSLPGSGTVVHVNAGSVNKRQVPSVLLKSIQAGYEGIVLRDTEEVYNFKRSNSLLKVKLMDTSDCEVVSSTTGDFPVNKDGVSFIHAILSLLVKQPDGLLCGVGSGFLLTDRIEWAKNPDQLTGKMMEVKHQGFGSDGRMRFPVFKGFIEPGAK